MPVGIPGSKRGSPRRIHSSNGITNDGGSNANRAPAHTPQRSRNPVRSASIAVRSETDQPRFTDVAQQRRYSDVGLMPDGTIVYPVEYTVSDHPYNKRSVQTRLREEQAYNVAMAKMCFEKNYLNLAYSYVMYAEELATISQEMKRD